MLASRSAAKAWMPGAPVFRRLAATAQHAGRPGPRRRPVASRAAWRGTSPASRGPSPRWKVSGSTRATCNSASKRFARSRPSARPSAASGVASYAIKMVGYMAHPLVPCRRTDRMQRPRRRHPCGAAGSLRLCRVPERLRGFPQRGCGRPPMASGHDARTVGPCHHARSSPPRPTPPRMVSRTAVWRRRCGTSCALA